DVGAHSLALRRAWESTGGAIAASGVTAIAGFGVLALSDIRMLRDFGLVTLIDLSVSLVGVLIALPAALTLAGRSSTGRSKAGELPSRWCVCRRCGSGAGAPRAGGAPPPPPAPPAVGARGWRFFADRWSARG